MAFPNPSLGLRTFSRNISETIFIYSYLFFTRYFREYILLKIGDNSGMKQTETGGILLLYKDFIPSFPISNYIQIFIAQMFTLNHFLNF